MCDDEAPGQSRKHMHLGRHTYSRLQSVSVGTAKENPSLEFEVPSGSVSLTNPRSKRHGYLLVPGKEAELSGAT